MVAVSFRRILVCIVLVVVNTRNVNARFSEDLQEDAKDKKRVIQPRVGNFALTTSQEPGPFVSFGQNIIDPGDLQTYCFIDYLKSKDKRCTEFFPAILYAINYSSSIYVGLPFVVRCTGADGLVTGIEDFFVQFEHTIWDHNALLSSNHVTVVGNIRFTTNIASNTPTTRFGVPSFFFGFTASHTDADWYPFVSSGVFLTTPHKENQLGHIFVYQAGLGKNLAYVSNKWIFNVLLEFDGAYKQADRVDGVTDPNSGGNQMLITPSLWFSTQRFIFQGGISVITGQRLFGLQTKDNYYINFNIGYRW